uniref:Uncharacterized protein n=1 Tax=viral metagenome TaxID=1070528 RepID=A0A6C0I4I2_9ZZZZ
MAKKCIPGLFCIDNMLLFLVIVILILLLYVMQRQNTVTIVQPQQTEQTEQIPNRSVSTRLDPINDPYSPPMSAAGVYFPPDSGDIRGVPINMRTRGMFSQYEQVGILTRSGNGSADNILPLLGRQVMTGRNKWQYYTMTSGSNLNTKLPIRVNGRDSTDEYGCDEITSRDNVYVAGYNDVFTATVYNKNSFQYIPV